MTLEEMMKDMLKHKKKYVARTITLEGGTKCLVIGIGSDGIRSLPIDSFVCLKKKELRERFEEMFTPQKVEVAMKEVEKRKQEINTGYN